MRFNTVNSQKLKFNSYQDAYLTFHSYHYQRGVNYLTKWLIWLGERYCGGNKKKIDLYFDLLKYKLQRRQPIEISMRIMWYHIDKIPSTIAQQIIPEAFWNAKSFLLKQTKDFHHEFTFKHFIVSKNGFKINEQTGKLILVNSKTLKQRFKDKVEFQLNLELLNHVKLTSKKFFLKFKYSEGKWFIDFQKQFYLNYEKVSEDKKLKFASIDIGLDNICLINQINFHPILFDLNDLLYENLKLFEKYSKYQSEGNERKSLIYRQKVVRNFKSQLKLYAIRIIQHLKKLGINRLSVGDVSPTIYRGNLNKVTRKLWNMVPFAYFKNYLKFQGSKNSIFVYEIGEWYTSKCSSITLEEISKHKNYDGKRINRGLFKVNDTVIHSDVNGALNILRNTITSRLITNNKIGENLENNINEVKKFEEDLLNNVRAISNIRRISFKQLNWLGVDLCILSEKSKDYGKEQYKIFKELVTGLILKNSRFSQPNKEQLIAVMHPNLILKLNEILLV